MKIKLEKSIIGTRKDTGEQRVHADEGDVLVVIFDNETHYICDSKHYPGEHIVVFHSYAYQVEDKDIDKEEFLEEKYYQVYEPVTKKNTDDSFYGELLSDDDS